MLSLKYAHTPQINKPNTKNATPLLNTMYTNDNYIYFIANYQHIDRWHYVIRN